MARYDGDAGEGWGAPSRAEGVPPPRDSGYGRRNEPVGPPRRRDDGRWLGREYGDRRAGGYRVEGFARGPFVPEEAYQRHPEFDRPPPEAQAESSDEEPGDEEIREAVLRYMRDDPWLDTRRISVEVEDGIVTLTGEVDDFLEARYAGDDAWEATGVLGVMNHLTVRTDLPAAPHGDVVHQTSGERSDPAETA